MDQLRPFQKSARGSIFVTCAIYEFPQLQSSLFPFSSLCFLDTNSWSPRQQVTDPTGQESQQETLPSEKSNQIVRSLCSIHICALNFYRLASLRCASNAFAMTDSWCVFSTSLQGNVGTMNVAGEGLSWDLQTAEDFLIVEICWFGIVLLRSPFVSDAETEVIATPKQRSSRYTFLTPKHRWSFLPTMVEGRKSFSLSAAESDWNFERKNPCCVSARTFSVQRED